MFQNIKSLIFQLKILKSRSVHDTQDCIKSSKEYMKNESLSQELLSDVLMGKKIFLTKTFDELQKLLSKTVFYQPLHGYPPIIDEEPQRHCLDRADGILSYLNRMGPARVLDVGCSFGYFSYFLTSRNYIVDSIDSDKNCIDICHFLKAYNQNLNNLPKFSAVNFDLDYIEKIPSDTYEIVLLLSVLHHITSEHGIPYVQDMMRALLEKVPVIITEIALREEEVPFPWKDKLPGNPLEIFNKCENFKIDLIGYYPTHLSSVKRPLYAVSLNKIHVNHQDYPLNSRNYIAHEDAHHYFRAFYESKNHFIKKYTLHNQHDDLIADNDSEIKNEIAVYNKLPKNSYFPALISTELTERSIVVVLSKLPGRTLKNYLESTTQFQDPEKIILSLLEAVRILRKSGYYHNDIRAWNIMLNFDEVYLYDFGRADLEEKESTQVAILWIIFQLHHHCSISYLKLSYPLTQAPDINLESMTLSLRLLTKKIMRFPSIDEYFKNCLQTYPE